MGERVMDWYQGVQVGQSILVGLAGIFVWVWGRQQKAERELLEGRFQRILERQEEHEEEFNRRLDSINHQLSSRLLPAIQDLIARVDRMPDELRVKFLPLDRAMDLIEESRRDRAALWNEITKRGGRRGPRE
jgi:hypothetical protein